jgi:hypothetical protein
MGSRPRFEEDDVSHVARWTIAMAAFGIIVGLVTYALTGSWWWALVGLLCAGIAANAITAGGRTHRSG